MPTTKRPLLSLVAMFKDEATSARALLESVKPFVDGWTVLDTGSTDGTQAIVRKEMLGVVGAVFEEPFVDYAASRNRALEIDSGQVHRQSSEFTLFLSGDEVLSGGAALREYLESKRDAKDGAYCVEMQNGPASWVYPRILRTDAKWRYEGEVHEVPVGPNRETSGPLIPGVTVVHTISDASKRWKRLREVDLPVLTKIVADESKPIADRGNAIWHLAITHEALADETPRTPGGTYLTHKLAAIANYLRYSEIATDETKRVHALTRYLAAAATAKLFRNRELLERTKEIASAAPNMPEIHYMVANCAAQEDARQGLFLAEEAARIARESRNHPTHAPTDSRMEWMALRLAAFCAQALKKEARARTLAERGIAAGGPAEEFKGFLGAA